jgi:hypothetical protein
MVPTVALPLTQIAVKRPVSGMLDAPGPAPAAGGRAGGDDHCPKCLETVIPTVLGGAAEY